MDKTPVDWEEFEAQAVLIQRLIADQLTSPESPHYITRLTEPTNLINLNVDSPLLELPASSFLSQTETCKTQALHLKSTEFHDLRSPLRNVTNSSCNNSTPEKQNSGPFSCPTSAEFKDFLLQIAEVSLVSHDSVNDSIKDDSLPLREKVHTRKGTYDVDSESTKTESGEACKSITRGRIGTYDVTPSSPLRGSLLHHKEDDNVFAEDTKTEPGKACKTITRKRLGTYDATPSSPVRVSSLNHIGEKTDENAFTEECSNAVKPVRLLIPPSLASCLLDDTDIVSSSSDESIDDQPEDPIPDSELLVVIDKVPSLKFSAKSKKKSKLTGSRVKSQDSSTTSSKTDEDNTASLVTSDLTKPVFLEGKDVVDKESFVAPSSNDVGSMEGVNDCLPAAKEANLQSATDSGASCEHASATSVDSESGNKANPVKNSEGRCVPSLRLIPKQASTPGTLQQNVDQKPPSKMTKLNAPAKRSSLDQPSQAKAAVDTSERKSLGAAAQPTSKPTLLKPGRLQPKLVAKRPSLETAGTKEQSEESGIDAMRPPDSILSKTVTKTQPNVSKLSQRSSKLQPPLPARETKASSQTSDVSQGKESKVNTVSRLSLLPSKPSIGRCLPPPAKSIPKPTGETTKTIPEPPNAAPESTRTAHMLIKAPLTATKTLRLVRPGFSRAPQIGTISAASSNSSLNESEKDAEETVSQKPIDAKPSAPGDVNTRTITQLKRKGPAPVKAIFQPSVPAQAEGSRTVTKEKNDTSRLSTKGEQPDLSKTVTKEKNDTSRLSTKGEQPDLSKTVTKVKPEDGKRTILSSSENVSPANAQVDNQYTPMKSEKVFNPRRLSDVFHNTVSPRSANAESKGKTSKIPTPRSSRFSSHSSSGSNTSFSSFRKPSDFESPMPGRKDSSDSSLSAFKPRRALVRYTPDVEPRRQSMWSPVKKKPLPDEDRAHLCTKKLRPGLEGSL